MVMVVVVGRMSLVTVEVIPVTTSATVSLIRKKTLTDCSMIVGMAKLPQGRTPGVRAKHCRKGSGRYGPTVC